MELTGGLAGRLQDYKYTPRSVSYLALNPGDLIEFNYNGSVRHGIVLGVKRNTGGFFISDRFTPLQCVLLCDSLEDSTFWDLLINMYMKPSIATYANAKAIPSLTVVNPRTGNAYVEKFRTLNVSNLSDIVRVRNLNLDE